MRGAGRWLGLVLAGTLLLPALGTAIPAAGLLPAPPFSPWDEGRGESPASIARIVLSRVYANAARDDEFVEIANVGDETTDLGGWFLTDREGFATFPPNTSLRPGQRLVATHNASAYAEDLLSAAGLTWDLGDAPLMEGTGLRLADAGDEVLLEDPTGAVRDAYAYGASSYAGRGWTGPPAPALGRGEVAVRLGADDHDDATDWDGPRRYRLGQSSFLPGPVNVDGGVVSLLSPEDGAAPLLEFLASARSSLHVAVYTLTSDAVAAVLAARARAGVRVHVLLEAAPVGGVKDSEARLAAGLAAAGADARWFRGSLGVVKRYTYLHAKYAVVDDEAVLVSSENFGESGFPSGERRGNRGWTVAIRDPEIARQLRDVFDEDADARRRDTVPVLPDPEVDLGPPTALDPWGWPAASCCRRVQLAVGPDNILQPGGLPEAIASARRSLDVEAFYAEDPWGPWSNPLIEAAFEAAGRGATVRILLDGTEWTAEAEATDNAAIVDRLNARARAAGVSFEARLLLPRGNVERLHNKGVVVDGRVVFVGSLNWARGSATENREIGLLLEDAGAALRFERAFEADWGSEGTPSQAPLLDPWQAAAVYALTGAASVASLRFLRRGDKRLRPRAGMKRRGDRTDLRGRHREVRVLPAELVAEPGTRARGRHRDRRGREAPRGGLGGTQGD